MSKPGQAIVVRGNALHLPLPDESVDLIISSPPYFALRSYRDSGEHYTGQIGSEPTPQEWLEALWACMAEWWRVLKPSGSVFVNLGDKRTGSGGHNNSGIAKSNWHTLESQFGTPRPSRERRAAEQNAAPEATRRNAPDRYNQAAFGRAKSKMLLPHRFAIGCEDGLADPEGIGWIVRQDLVWSKLNCLSGGTVVYAKVKGRPIPIKLHDLCRHYAPEQVQLWTGWRWTNVLAWERTERHPEATESIKAIRAARRIGAEPVLAADLEIELRSGERIGCTREHRWPTQRGLVESAGLAVGDVIDATWLPNGEVTPTALDDELVGWFVGLYIAEGSRSEGTIQIAGNVKELERFKRLRELADAFHGTCNVYTDGQKGNVTLTGRFLDAILSSYVGGRIAKDKHLAPKCWERSNTFLRAVLDGYLSGDGYYESKPDRWVLGFTDNDQLASDLRVLGARLGLSVRLRRCTHTGFGREWPGWTGSIVMDPARRRSPDSQIVAIRQSRARRFWDVAIEGEPHLFALGSGVLTHNSLPESVQDRHRDSHEFIFHLTKQERYFAAMDEIREAHTGPLHAPGDRKVNLDRNDNDRVDRVFGHPSGKLPGSVWPMASEPLTIPTWAREKFNLPDHFACVDEDTEILTQRGWMRHDQLEAGEDVAGYDLDTGLARWTVCKAVHAFPFDGELVAVEKRDLSMRLTTNHRCLAAGPDHWTTRNPGPLGIVLADELAPKHFVPRSAEWECCGPWEKSIGVDLAALCGWVAAEGYYQNDLVRLSQSLAHNPEKVAAIDALLGRFPFQLAQRAGRKTYRPTLGFLERKEQPRIYRGEDWIEVVWRLPLWLGHEVQTLMPDKLLGPWALELPEDERRALLEAFIDGDGHRRPDGRMGIYQKERQNLDILQAVAVTLGYKTTLRQQPDKWVLYLTNGRRPITLRGTNGSGKPIPREHYKGIVWCPTTGTGTFIARRNGSVFITGNSFPTELPRKLILGFSPSGICLECGEGRRPVVDRQQRAPRNPGTTGFKKDAKEPFGRLDGTGYAGKPKTEAEATIIGYACACTPYTDHKATRAVEQKTYAASIEDGEYPSFSEDPDRTHAKPGLWDRPKTGAWREYHLDRWTPPPTRPAVICDPFCGTGTVPMVAKQLGRIGIGIDLSADYSRLAQWRIAHPPPKVMERTWGERQGSLL